MKKFFIAAVAALAMSLSVSAQNQEKLDGFQSLTAEEIEAQLNDFKYFEQKVKSERHRWNIVYSKSDDPKTYNLAGKYSHGRYGALVTGVKMIDGEWRPTIGFEVGHDGRRTGWFAGGKWLAGHYTNTADRINPYTEFDFQAGAKLKLLKDAENIFTLWARAAITYELRFDYHENKTIVESHQETDEEILKIINEVDNSAEFKGSPFGGLVGLEGGLTPYWSSWSVRLFVGYGMQQYYYSTGQKWHGEFVAELKLAYNFDTNEIWDSNVLNTLGLSKSQAKKLAKRNLAVRAY